MKRYAIAFGLLVTALTGCKEIADSPTSSATPPQVRALAGETRDYLQWPFPADSIWNMPLHTNASYSSAGIQAANQFGFAADEDILILTPNAPLKTVYVNTAGWDASKTRCGTINYALKNFGGTQVPVPDNFSTDPGYGGTTPNQSAAILMPDGVTVKQTQPLHVCGNGGTVTSGGDANGSWEYPDDNLKTGDGIGGAHGGPRMSSIGGTIRVGELRPGSTLRHALKLQIDGKFLKYNDDGTRGYRWPGTAADSNASWYYTGANPQMEIGALVAVAPGFNVNGLRTEAAKILARAFRDYGAYIVDTTGWDTYQLTYEWGPAGRFMTQFKSDWGFDVASPPLPTCTDTTDQCKFSKDIADIMTQLNVITNNSPSSIGGGATTDITNRRAAQAPPFGGSSPLPAPPPAPTGLLQNSSFESDLSNWSSSGTTSAVSGGNTGSKAALLGSSGLNVQGELQQGVSLQSGASYTVTAYFKNAGSAWCSVGVKGSGSAGWFNFHGESSGAGFTQASATFTAPSGISFASAYVWKTSSTGTCTADDVTVSLSGSTTPPPPPPPSTNLALNAGFESDFSSWGSTSGTNSIAGSGARTGAKAALLGSSGLNVQGERQQSVNLQSGATYTVGAYFKSDGNAWCSVGVKGSSSAGWFDFHGESGGAGYAPASQSFTAPSGIGFANLYVWKTSSSGTCTVDDVSLVKQ